ncbi:PREDICTED: uncharacterized protein LOC108780819 [Cyphomyrmex costatus]|uniref:uncharacterized protein LOC108780819 n=1 Tax=Cyphomyrmex costatus TaxID=456900 RepID=UPI0008522322|nr:PREDICTED: uncharacterized protein LOC108780819 [Cyphomyrmex costatus]
MLKQAARIKVHSRLNSYNVTINCLVVDNVTEKLPAFSLKRNEFDFPHNVKLADPRFNVSSEIDLLIGAEIFWDLLCVGQIKASSKHPTLQKTRFGWIMAGRLDKISQSSSKVLPLHASISNKQLHAELGKFWQLTDSTDKKSEFTIEESICEQHFQNNVGQNEQGRFVVKLPVRDHSLTKLGESREIALNRLRGLEKRFDRQPEFKALYSEFINEYVKLGHMRPVKSIQSSEESLSVFLPHHGIFKTTGQISKIRVVFDASCKDSSGLSLNDVLMVGPVVQQDLVSILMRFRMFRYAIVADIIKMYRQILVHPSQTCLQRILWRENPTDQVSTYELLTLTYGTSSAPYLATRCLIYLANLFSSKYLTGSKHLICDFYMDDMLAGADTIKEAEVIRDEMIELLREGGFELDKWASNCPGLMKGLDNQNNKIININDDIEARILGIRWNRVKDTFHFHCEPVPASKFTKRIIVSEVTRVFDPLGLLGPVVVLAKLIIQELWQIGIEWDEAVPPDIHMRWITLRSQLEVLNQLQIPRVVKFDSNSQLVQIHGFSDASQRAYGACVYLRTKVGPHNYRIELLCSRSRVAPLKAVSLPRLELCAALLLARLISKVCEPVQLEHAKKFFWSDSMITLNWIGAPSRKWTPFVANRVGEIQRLTEFKDWQHVRSSNNPADVLLRGLNPKELIDNDLWWHGPPFLQDDDDLWPRGDIIQSHEDLPESRMVSSIATLTEGCVINQLLARFSRLSKIIRIVAYCLRFSKKNRPSNPSILISPTEASHALNIVCKAVQKQSFSKDYEVLQRKDSIAVTSNIRSLTPFIDESGLLRVGGRLGNSNLESNARHPILIPRNHILTQLIIEQEHKRNLHAGLQATMANVRQQFWSLSLRSATRRVIQNCITCFKVKPRFSEAIMGSLPAGRVTMSRPFTHCGVDYAGPVSIKEGKRRNGKHSKAYVSIFVCFATRAVHIELVSDLTTDAFIAAFKRFISRRGKPSKMYSDNGTSFVGARNQIKEFFIPRNAPHVSGLWEAAVKSAKHHLTRIAGQAHLTFEKLQTALCEIEAVLNSRPITPLSTDPNDLEYLTPGHFLIGEPLNSFPCRDVSDVNENRLIRWHRVEQIRQHFWRRWSTEYLHSLQERTKWRANKGLQLQPNQLVLIKQQNLAPLQWMLGRIQQIHPGADNVARTATVKTVNGSLVRPLSKLAILPLELQNSHLSCDASNSS